MQRRLREGTERFDFGFFRFVVFMLDNLSILIKEALLDRVRKEFGKIPTIREQIHTGRPDLLTAISNLIEHAFEAVATELSRVQSPVEREMILAAGRQTLFRERVKQNTLEEIYSESIYNSFRVLPTPASPQERSEFMELIRSQAEAYTIHAVVFEYLPNVLNELFPLMIDDYVNCMHIYHKPKHLFIGVHSSWLDDDLRANRAMVFIGDSCDIVECSLDPCFTLDSVQFLCLSPAQHEFFSQRFEEYGIFQINPYPFAQIADDKYQCFQRWRAAGAPTPEAVLIPGIKTRVDNGEKDLLPLEKIAQAFHTLFPQTDSRDVTLVVQPNRGTEGRGAAAFTGSAKWEDFYQAHPELLTHARQISFTDDILMRRGVGNVRISKDSESEPVFFDIRINVADGRAESGFIMAAKGEEIIASPGRGGRIWEWNSDQDFTLWVDRQSQPLLWNSEIWTQIKQTAEHAAAGFPECRLVGIDLRLERQIEKSPAWIPWVLDLNPRPAGLTHSRYLDSGEPGVTQHLWICLPIKKSEKQQP